ncbi:MAG: hypothetical protein M1541_15340 [Acidobacteria bacterium]|nr:hypothetical protein [Acidobacteriota bacterium]
MPYVLRVVQLFLPRDREAFMQVEAKFAAMERQRSDFPKGRRFQPVTGRMPSNTLIWESQEFATLGEVHAAISKMETDAGHAKLFREQVPYITEAYLEIEEVLKF